MCVIWASSYDDGHPHLNAYVASSHFITLPLHKVCYIVVLVWLFCVSFFFSQKLFKVKAIPKDDEALVDESAEGAIMDAMVNESQEEIEMIEEAQEEIDMIEEGTNGPQTKESLVGEGDDDGERGDDDGERPLRLGDLEKV